MITEQVSNNIVITYKVLKQNMDKEEKNEVKKASCFKSLNIINNQ